MYAVIEISATQFKVKEGDTIDVNKLELKDDKPISIDKVLLLSKDKKIEVGQPYLKGVKVKAEVLGQVKGEKVVSFKYRRRKIIAMEEGFSRSTHPGLGLKKLCPDSFVNRFVSLPVIRFIEL